MYFARMIFKARQSIASLTEPVNCISILGVFHKLMKMGHEKTEMQEYYDCLAAFLKNQTECKVWSYIGTSANGSTCPAGILTKYMRESFSY